MKKENFKAKTSFEYQTAKGTEMFLDLPGKKEMKHRLKEMKAIRRHSGLPSLSCTIAVLGDGGVGKTSILKRYLDGEFKEVYEPTISEIYEKHTKRTDRNGNLTDYDLKIFDSAGLHSFPAMRRLTVSQSDAFILVYSVDSERSFECAKILRREITQVKGLDRVPCVLVGNKSDLDSSKRKVTFEKGLQFAVDASCSFVEVSAKEDKLIEDVFQGLLRSVETVELMKFRERSLTRLTPGLSRRISRTRSESSCKIM